jgi:hypothetical protein
VPQQVDGAPKQGVGWREAAVGAGIAIGILLLGLWGYVAVGAVLAGVPALLGAGVMLVAPTARRVRAGRGVYRPHDPGVRTARG